RRAAARAAAVPPVPPAVHARRRHAARAEPHRGDGGALRVLQGGRLRGLQPHRLPRADGHLRGDADQRQDPPPHRAARRRRHGPRRGDRRRHGDARRGRAREGEDGADQRRGAVPRRHRSEGGADALPGLPGGGRRRLHGLSALRPPVDRGLPEVRPLAPAGLAVLSVLHDEHRAQAVEEAAPRSAARARASARERGRIQEQSLRTYYEMLSVARDAPSEEIKKAFRREIARYHPDKVQHLGPEFQEMASGIAADLTEAYRVLMDPELRTKYDEEVRSGAGSATGQPGPRPQTPEPAAPPPPPPGAFADPPPPPPPGRPPAGFDFVRRVALSKIREAIDDVFGGAEPFPAHGFDVAIVTKPKRGLFRKAAESVCLAIKFVPFVDADAIAAVWGPALKLRAPGASACAVILLGAGLAPSRDL